MTVVVGVFFLFNNTAIFAKTKRRATDYLELIR